MKQNLVLVPGHLCDSRMWRHQSDHLSDIADITIADTMQDDTMTGIAARLLHEAPDRFALAGLSMGGHICMEVMRQAPQRVTRLALLDTGARDDTPERLAARREMIANFEDGALERLAADFASLLLPPERVAADPELAQAVRAMVREVARKAFPGQVKALMGRPDSRGDMPRYACPTLVLCGRQDTLTPLAGHEEMAGLIPGARLAVIEECGHMSTMERPQAVTALLRDWLLYR